MKTTPKKFVQIALLLLICQSCTEPKKQINFGYDLDFLSQNTKTIVLKNNNEQCQIAIVPAFQGRVMTSTSKGRQGKSYGWINYDLISSNTIQEHINAYGGEDRFWLGPEGGQYAIFFENGTPFTLDHWNTPKVIDTEPFNLMEQGPTHAIFDQDITLKNYQNFEFQINVNRKISLLQKEEIEQNLAIDLNETLAFVGYQSDNVMTNMSSIDWNRNSGLLSIWILGMFTPSDQTAVIIPFKDSLALNTSYFGAIEADRLKVKENTILFKGDGKYRSKIGIPPQNALPTLGSYDLNQNILTVIQYTLDENASYVNSLWETQEDPYGGDVVNSYNDGPLDNGGQLGPFYELETSSPARALKAYESIKHIHRTYHFEGSPEALNTIAKKVFGTDLNTLEI